MDEVVSLDVEDELIRECEVRGCAGVEVEVEDFLWVCDNGLEFDGIDEWLRERGVF